MMQGDMMLDDMMQCGTDFICVVCPKGCDLHASQRDDGSVIVEGNRCARGIDYAKAELSNPTRSLSLALCIPGMLEPLSVKTSVPVPKGMLLEVAKEAYSLQGSIRLPVHVGDTVIENICGTEADLIATKSAPVL